MELSISSISFKVKVELSKLNVNVLVLSLITQAYGFDIHRLFKVLNNPTGQLKRTFHDISTLSLTDHKT